MQSPSSSACLKRQCNFSVLSLLTLLTLLKLLTLFALLLLSSPSSLASSLIRSETFANLKTVPGPRLVLFYHSSDSSAPSILKTLKRVAKRLKQDTLVPNEFEVVKCDGDESVNVEEFKTAGFASGTNFIFTSTPIEGIVKYTRSHSVQQLVSHIHNKYLPFNESDVLQFSDILTFYDDMDHSGKVRFVKFFEQWCQHCSRLKQTFQQAASYFAGVTGKNRQQIEFVEVECSKNNATTEFCTREGVKSYPVLTLFTGESKQSFNEEMRSIDTFEEFLAKHVKGWIGKANKSKKEKNEKIDADREDAQTINQLKDRSKETAKSNIESILWTANENTIESSPTDKASLTHSQTDTDAAVASKPSSLQMEQDELTRIAQLEQRISKMETQLIRLTELLEKPSTTNERTLHDEL